MAVILAPEAWTVNIGNPWWRIRHSLRKRAPTGRNRVGCELHAASPSSSPWRTLSIVGRGLPFLPSWGPGRPIVRVLRGREWCPALPSNHRPVGNELGWEPGSLLRGRSFEHAIKNTRELRFPFGNLLGVALPETSISHPTHSARLRRELVDLRRLRVDATNDLGSLGQSPLTSAHVLRRIAQVEAQATAQAVAAEVQDATLPAAPRATEQSARATEGLRHVVKWGSLGRDGLPEATDGIAAAILDGDAGAVDYKIGPAIFPLVLPCPAEAVIGLEVARAEIESDMALAARPRFAMPA